MRMRTRWLWAQGPVGQGAAQLKNNVAKYAIQNLKYFKVVVCNPWVGLVL